MLALVLTVVVALSLFTYCLYLIPPSSTPLVPTTPPITNSRILLLTAHPDDECMFFGPTLLKLAEKEVRNEIWGLCLSTGNFDGIGHIRKYELIKSYQTLGVDPSHVTVLDHSELQDGMKNNWRPELVAEVVKDVVKNNSIDVIITFDYYGISGHPNHIACFNGASHLLHTTTTTTTTLKLYTLVSVPLARKFVGLFDLPYTTLLHRLPSSGASPDPLYVSAPSSYLAAHRAMRHHHSQLVWFRWLYVVFSRYMYVNGLKRAV